MSVIKIMGDDIYVGQRVEVEVTLFNQRTKEAATALAPELVFGRPDETEIEVGTMTEVPAGSGIYYGSGVVDLEGKWRVQVTVGEPFESVFKYGPIYVSA